MSFSKIFLLLIGLGLGGCKAGAGVRTGMALPKPPAELLTPPAHP